MRDTDAPLSNIPAEGTLGVLADGWRGLVSWRAVRGTAWIEERREALAALGVPDAPEEPSAPDASLADVTVTVVSGLPRSGTSMVMQMLTAGGLTAFTDGRRTADESNPRGFFEHDRVKALATDSAWVREADGRVVKVVSPLLPHLPPGPTYRVLVLRRDLDEVLASQTAMLGALGHGAAAADVLRRHYQQAQAQALAWARRTPRASALVVPHAGVLADPAAQADRIAEFLGGALDRTAMAAAVDPALHRQRAAHA